MENQEYEKAIHFYVEGLRSAENSLGKDNAIYLDYLSQFDSFQESIDFKKTIAELHEQNDEVMKALEELGGASAALSSFLEDLKLSDQNIFMVMFI